MSPRYEQYESDGVESNDSNDNSDSYDDDPQAFQIAPYSTIEGVPQRLFGTDSPYGETSAVVWDDVELIDGAVYENDANGKWRLFSWQDVAGRPVSSFLEDGNDFTADRAQQYMRQTYGSNDIEYSLVMARVPEQVTESGEVIQEPTAVAVDDGSMVEINPESVSLPEIIIWQSANGDAPSAGDRTTVKYMAEQGHDIVQEDYGDGEWLTDTSGNDFLRDDLRGRRLQYFLVKKQSNASQYMFTHPVLWDVELEQEVRIKNSQSPDGDGEASGADGASESSASPSENGSTPAPLGRFYTQAAGLELDESGAFRLLEDMVEGENGLTQEMVDNNGGEQAVVNEVLHS